jgi:hypothetical protein
MTEDRLRNHALAVPRDQGDKSDAPAQVGCLPRTQFETSFNGTPRSRRCQGRSPPVFAFKRLRDHIGWVSCCSLPCLPDPRSGSVAFPKMRPSSRKVMAREPRPMTKDFRALANVTGQAKTWRGYALLPGAVAGQPSPSPREPSPGIRASLLTQAKFFQHERSCRSPRGDTQSPRLSTILVSTFYPPGNRYG